MFQKNYTVLNFNYKYSVINFLKLLVVLIFISLISCKKEEEKIPKKLNKKIARVVVDSISNSSEEDYEFQFEKLPQKETHSLLAALILNEIENAEEDLRNPYFLDTITGNYRIRFDNKIDPFTVYFDVMKVVDLNNDNINDYIIHRISEGMLGGNFHSNSNYSYYIMKNDREYSQECEILEYAPFSYNILDNVKLIGNKLIAEASKNFRTYGPESSEDEDNKMNIKKLSFEYSNGNLYEKSYLTDCELANLESKTIFDDYPEVAFRRREIEIHNYTEVISEQYKFSENEYINATLSGCDNLNLEFDYYYPIKTYSGYNNKEIKENAIEIVDFLIEKTQFKEELEIIRTYFAKHSTFNKVLKDINGNEFSIYTKKEDKTIEIHINITMNTNENQQENWEITTRKK